MQTPLGTLRGQKSKPAPGSHTPAAPLLLDRLETGKIGGTWYVPSSIPNQAVEEQTRIQLLALGLWLSLRAKSQEPFLQRRSCILTACPNSPRSKPSREASIPALQETASNPC